MPSSSATRTSWSFGSSQSRVDHGPSTTPLTGSSSKFSTAQCESRPADAPVELRDVSLRFVNYHDKQYSLKRAALDLTLGRQGPAPSSEFWALRDVSIRLEKGDRVGILGSNGAGKSTLLRVLARIYPPTSGSLRVSGTVAPLIEMGAGFNPELSGH